MSSLLTTAKVMLAIVFYLLSLLVFSSAHATETDSYSVKRNIYKLARYAFAANQLSAYQDFKSQLRDYPLYPYLLYSELRKRLAMASDDEIEDFLTAYSDLPVSGQLRGAWLRQLIEQDRWSKFLSVYDDRSDTDMRCYNTRAQIRAGQEKEVLQEAKLLWLSGRSQPKTCDRLFEWMQDTGVLTSELIWQRIYLAMENDDLGLARFLARKLNENDRQLMSLWEKVHTQPLLNLEAAELVEDSVRNRTIVSDGIRRLALTDLDRAHSIWNRISKRYAYSAQLHDRLDHDLALSAAFRNHPLAETWLSALPDDAHDEDTRRWRAHLALRNSDWRALLTSIELLDQDERLRDKWRYWQARALLETDESAQAKPLLDTLAKERSYYGFLAADITRAPYSMNNTPLTRDAERLGRINALSAVTRAHELYRVGQIWEARTEWNLLTSQMDNQDIQTAALLAGQWGWHDNAISTVAKTMSYDDLELRFPLAYKEQVITAANSQSVDSGWVYAVIRRESAFAADARSPAGAVGLMQLLPTTATQVARNNKLPAPGLKDLLDAKQNIVLGSGYLRYLLDRYNDAQVLATAAYNAGPGRVTRWLPERGSLPADQWIDTIPFKETRQYVRAVMEYSTVYEWKLGKKTTRLSERLRPVRAALDG